MKSDLSVLYVEDDPQSRRIMKMMLKGRLSLSEIALWEDSSDFPQRIAALNPSPDVIFLDIHVEPYNGFEMLAYLREAGFTAIPIIAVTASVMNEEVDQLKQAGFSGCLAKPLDIDHFPDVLERILQGEFIWHIVH